MTSIRAVPANAMALFMVLALPAFGGALEGIPDAAPSPAVGAADPGEIGIR
ncbi:hypothetical protein [Thiocapsa bogorovii]|uniref:hypothetical protein n=1 Tax=Thiocapsa bogorovii TaxID=521689 RepID=UPI001E2BC337|nr:hypothetical protein [Thiocapsa bogorovii]UHD15975.1 hypothetical protein LT988_22425 [Thiocapsa bogorovii]